MEPWPGGRTNHYYFDLNRDWAWQTQIESQLRIVKYNEWLPHIHVDFHEQGYNSPYYFAPAAKPLHQYITDWQRDFQKTIGKEIGSILIKNGISFAGIDIIGEYLTEINITSPTCAREILDQTRINPIEEYFKGL